MNISFAFNENLPFPHPKSILIIRTQKPPLISLWIHSQSKGLQVMRIHLMTKELQEKNTIEEIIVQLKTNYI